MPGQGLCSSSKHRTSAVAQSTGPESGPAKSTDKQAAPHLHLQYTSDGASTTVCICSTLPTAPPPLPQRPGSWITSKTCTVHWAALDAHKQGAPRHPEATPGVAVATGITGKAGPAGACASCAALQAGSVCWAPSTAALPVGPWRHSRLLSRTLLQPCINTLTSKPAYHAAWHRASGSALKAVWQSAYAGHQGSASAVLTAAESLCRPRRALPTHAVCSQDSKLAGSQLARRRDCMGVAGRWTRHS